MVTMESKNFLLLKMRERGKQLNYFFKYGKKYAKYESCINVPELVIQVWHMVKLAL